MSLGPVAFGLQQATRGGGAVVDANCLCPGDWEVRRGTVGTGDGVYEVPISPLRAYLQCALHTRPHLLKVLLTPNTAPAPGTKHRHSGDPLMHPNNSKLLPALDSASALPVCA